MASAGHIRNGNYSTRLYGAVNSKYKDILENSGLNEYRDGSSEVIRFNKDDIEGYYNALQKTYAMLREAGYENEQFANSVKSQLDKLNPYYEELSTSHKELISSLAADIDNFGLRDEDLNNLLTSGSFGDYINEENREELINGISELYDISPKDVDEILSKTNIVG